MLKGLGPWPPGPLRTVGQGLYPVEHADGHRLSADWAVSPGLRRLLRGQAAAAVAVAVQMVLSLLWVKFHRAGQSLPGLQSPAQGGIGGRDVQQIGLPPQLGGGMGVRMGDQLIPVQGGEPPIHGRIRGEPCLQGVDVPAQVAKAGLQAVKAGKGPEHREMGGPDVGRDEDGLRTGLQGDLQQVPGVQPQDGPPVRADVADGLQLPGEEVGGLQGGQQDHAVDLPGPAVLFIDGADLSRDHKTGLRPRSGVLLKAVPGPQGVEPLLRWDQLLRELGPPGRMGEVPRPHQVDALPPGPEVQVLRHAVPAGGPGVLGVDMQVRDQHRSPSPLPFPGSGRSICQSSMGRPSK